MTLQPFLVRLLLIPGKPVTEARSFSPLRLIASEVTDIPDPLLFGYRYYSVTGLGVCGCELRGTS